MRVLLDESLPRQLKRFLPDHHVRTVAEEGWSGIKNGVLLGLAQQSFDVFVTADRGIEYQQNLQQVGLGIVLLVARTNRLVDYEPLAAELAEAVEAAGPGELRKVSALTE